MPCTQHMLRLCLTTPTIASRCAPTPCIPSSAAQAAMQGFPSRPSMTSKCQWVAACSAFLQLLWSRLRSYASSA